MNLKRLLSFAMAIACIASLVSCGDERPLDVQIKFSALVGNQLAACNVSYNGVGTGSDTISFEEIKLFVSEIALVTADGVEVPLTLNHAGIDAPWQEGAVALLDFADGSGNCSNTSPETRTVVRGSVPTGDYVGLKFTVGVPFALNHTDSPTAQAPLNDSTMAWSWRSGRKFARIDMNVVGSGGWNVHLGSTMCDAPDGITAPTVECARSNRTRVTLPAFDTTMDNVVLRLDEILANSDVGANAPNTASGCESSPEDADCDAVFDSFGLDFATGSCANDCASQVAFDAVRALPPS